MITFFGALLQTARYCPTCSLPAEPPPWRYGRERLLLRMNILFAVVVVWNLVALIVGAVRGPF